MAATKPMMGVHPGNWNKASWVGRKMRSRGVKFEKSLEVGGEARDRERNWGPWHMDVI